MSSAGTSTYATVITKKATMMPEVDARCGPGSIRGADLIFADSFRYATIEPVNVTAPMKTPTNTSTSWMLGYRTIASSYELFQPTSTAARPTKLCSMAISSGMPVISTRRARHMPIAPPIAIAEAISARPERRCPRVAARRGERRRRRRRR